MKRLLLLILLCLSTSLFAQKGGSSPKINVSNTKAVFLGKVSPSQDVKKTTLSERSKLRKDKQLPPNFIGRGKSKAIIKELEHQGKDPLRQTRFSEKATSVIEPIVNVDGLFNSFGSPHDPTGSIGTNHYVQAINATEIGIFDKSGTKLSEFAANSLWEPLGETSLGDPIVMFDHETNQWIITEFAEPALLLIAVSDDDDPTGDYSVYSFATPNFPDYPKYAIWKDLIVVTTNETGPGSLHQYFIDRQALMAGSNDVTIQRVEIQGNSNTEAGFYVTTPVHWNGSLAPADDRPIAVKINDSSWGEVSEDALEIFSFNIDLADESNTTVDKLTLETTPFDSYPCDRETGGFACLSQGGDGSGGLDAIPEVVMNIPHYRNFGTHEAIVLNFITDVTNGDNLSGIRWMELRRTEGTDWSIYQEGTFAPDDGLHRYMGSIGIDVNGNIGMAYNVSSPTEFAGIRFTGRYPDDPLGEMTVQEYDVVSGINLINTDRFGDYPHITVDPVDGSTFWYTAEYGGNGTSNSKTRLLSFQLEKKDNDIAVVEIVSPETGADLTASEEVVATILNNGNLSATGFDITLTLDGNIIETSTYNETLEPEATYDHTFSTAVDLSTIGEYEIEVSISYAADEANSNDSKTKNIRKLADLDGEIELVTETETCNSSSSAEVILINRGETVITAAEIEVSVNGTAPSTTSFTGSLSTGDQARVVVDLQDLAAGTNDVVATLASVNTASDDVANNNSANSTITVDDSQDQIVFTLNTDEYPSETTWQLAFEDGSIIHTGGPYSELESTIIEYLCVPQDECFIFTIFDSAGDGLCCDYGQGSYNLADGAGNTLFESDGIFESSQNALICVGEGTFTAVDAAISIITNETSICLTDFPASFEIMNMGLDELTSLNVDVTLNGSLVETIEWTGTLEFGESYVEELSLGSLPQGANTIHVEAKNPNGTTDEKPDNNEDEWAFENAGDLMLVEISLTTDDFPDETIWGILDDQGEVIYANGPFEGQENTTLIEQTCLQDESCYTFVIIDTYGDGIVNGAYSITDSFGEVVTSGDLDFTDRFEADFCLDAADACKLEVSIDHTDSNFGVSDGTIFISATGALSILYSIDGGTNFQESNAFFGLSEGSYDVVVYANEQCQHEETVMIGGVLGAEEKNLITIFPNPTTGIFKVQFESNNTETEFLNLEVINLEGKVIQTRKFSKYGNEYVGTVSLVAYPKGVYFLRLHNSTEGIVTKVIKE